MKTSLRNLAGELGVKVSDLSEAQMMAVAERFTRDGRLRADVLRKIVQDVRATGEPPAGEAGALPDPSASPPRRGMHFNATEAADYKMRRRLALVHNTEERRSGLYVRPRRPDALPADKPHPGCLVAVRSGTEPCSRCSWLLEGDPYAEAWLDRDD